MSRKPAHLIAEALREIRQDKVLTVDANGKRMAEEKRERYARHISALDDAIDGFDNLARVQAEKQQGGAA
jgi:hypothetical protein